MSLNEQVRLAKVTLNIGVGEGGENLANAKTLLERLTGGKTAVLTKAHARNPSFKIRKGDPIGAKITLRGAPAEEIVKKALDARETALSPESIDKAGNVAFGVREYIDFPGMRYDPKLGMMGFDVCLTLEKPGGRVARRKIRRSKLPKKQRVSKSEAIAFMEKKFGAKFEEAHKQE